MSGHISLFQAYLQGIFAAGMLGYLIYFILGCVRGFTLIPATYLLLPGLLIFPPLPLFVMTLASGLISALCIYYFAESFHLYKFFERKHKKNIQKIRRTMEKDELLMVITWNLLPIVPSDLISYACGIFKVNKHKFLFGTLIGQGIYFALIIFIGNYLIRIFAV